MARVCEICGKGNQNGNSVSHSNVKTKRIFSANLQKIKINDNGTVRYAHVCTTCIKSNKVSKSK